MSHEEHEWHITKTVRVPKNVEVVTKYAMSVVWDAEIGAPTRFMVQFVGELMDSKTGQTLPLAAAYNPKNDKFYIAYHSEHFRNSGIPCEPTAVLVASHETMHRVQFVRGDDVKPSFYWNQRLKRLTLRGDYPEDLHEFEAWEASVHAFKYFYPESSGAFESGGIIYEIPRKSKYQ